MTELHIAEEVGVAPRRLNVGCGNDIREDYVNLDIAALPGVDVVHDIDTLPFPFPDNSFDHIECIHVLEHVKELVPTVRELHRILAPGGRLRIKGPHFTSYTWPTDPTHRRAFAYSTFGFFVRNNAHSRDYYFDFHFSQMAYSLILFQMRWQPWNKVVQRVVNTRGRIKEFYEATFLARLFPALEVDVELVK